MPPQLMRRCKLRERRSRQLANPYNGSNGFDRRSVGIREIAVILTLLLNFGGLVWGAAVMASSVSDLKFAVDKINNIIDVFASKINNHDGRIQVLEDRSIRKQ